jgi:hypothetical protein
VAKQRLHVSDVATALKQVRSKTVPESVAAGRFRQTRTLHRDFHGVLQIFLLNVMASRVKGSYKSGTFDFENS